MSETGVRELLLLRHGESEGNVAAARASAAGAEVIDVPARDPDVGLSDLGRSQARAVAGALRSLQGGARPDLVACSPYLRALETARLACDDTALAVPMHVDERLRDRELGVLDRLTEAGVASLHPEELARRQWQGKFYHRPAGGESWVDVVARLRSWLSDADRRWPGRRVLVVSHDVVVLLLRYVCEELDEERVLGVARAAPMRNAALSRYVRRRDGRWSVAAYDDVEHLRAAGLPVTEHPGERRDAT